MVLACSAVRITENDLSVFGFSGCFLSADAVAATFKIILSALEPTGSRSLLDMQVRGIKHHLAKKCVCQVLTSYPISSITIMQIQQAHACPIGTLTRRWVNTKMQSQKGGWRTRQGFRPEERLGPGHPPLFQMYLKFQDLQKIQSDKMWFSAKKNPHVRVVGRVAFSLALEKAQLILRKPNWFWHLTSVWWIWERLTRVAY